MDHREQIQDLAHTVGRGLTAYIEVHNKIHEEASTLKSVVKNIFGRATPMSELLHEAERMQPLWRSIRQQLEEFRTASLPALATHERHYLHLLASYADAVSKTVDLLVDRQRLLNEGSKTRKNSPMTWDAFQEKNRAYKAAVEGYKAIGQELNDAAHLVFD
jgi:hypothetical protein